MYINEYRLDLDEDCRPCLVKTSRYHVDGRVKYNCPDILSDFIFYDLGIGKRAEEHLYLLMLDNAGHMIGVSEISHGTANQSLCDVQSILTKALLMGAKKVVMTHNHPSGDVFPSAEDRLVTKRVQAALELSGITLVDHIIVCDTLSKWYYSFYAHGEIEKKDNVMANVAN